MLPIALVGGTGVEGQLLTSVNAEAVRLGRCVEMEVKCARKWAHGRTWHASGGCWRGRAPPRGGRRGKRSRPWRRSALRQPALLARRVVHRLLSAFHERIGVPMVLNTSFNENEPIVHRPEEALDCFLRTDMDVLVLGPWVVRKEGTDNRGREARERPVVQDAR